MHSHHSHSGTYCAHASADTSPTSILDKAHKLGFETYCLSEHVPRSQGIHLYPEELEAKLRPSDLLRQFEEYLIEAKRCSHTWKGKMKVLVGAELENIDDECIKYLEEVLNSGRTGRGVGAEAGMGRVDYLIGSVHHVDSIPIDLDKATFESVLDNFRHEEDGVEEGVVRRRAHLRLISRYLDQQHELIEYFRPEIVGHFDLCRLYEPNTPMASGESQFDIALLQQVHEAVVRNVLLVCSYGGLFEVNSASIRKGWRTPYPGSDVLDVILSNGGRLCLSDDAHSHEQVGLNYHKVRQYLVSKGVTEIWKLVKDDKGSVQVDDSTSFPRGTRAVQVPDWANDLFWQV